MIPPESTFITDEFVTPDSMARVLQRIRGASTGGTVTGLHGTNIVSVKALPGGQTLTTGSLNTVTTTIDLSFAVTVADSGNFQEVHIPVTLTIENGGSPIVQTQTIYIQLINPGDQTVLTFTNLGSVTFGTQTTMKVDVKPVPGEVNISNNSASYPVIFSLPRLSRHALCRRQTQRPSASPGARSGSPACRSRGSRGCAFAASATRSAS